MHLVGDGHDEAEHRDARRRDERESPAEHECDGEADGELKERLGHLSELVAHARRHDRGRLEHAARKRTAVVRVCVRHRLARKRREVEAADAARLPRSGGRQAGRLDRLSDHLLHAEDGVARGEEVDLRHGLVDVEVVKRVEQPAEDHELQRLVGARDHDGDGTSSEKHGVLGVRIPEEGSQANRLRRFDFCLGGLCFTR